MMNQIQYSDVQILLQLFFPEGHDIDFQDSAHLFLGAPLMAPTKDIKPKERVWVHSGKQNVSHKINLSPPDYILDFSGKSGTVDGYETLTFYYKTHGQGQLRWVYPNTNIFPRFLNFYHQSNQKTKLYAGLLHTAFYLGISHWFLPHFFQIHYKRPLVIDQLLEPINCESYSIYFERHGLHPIITLEINNRGLTTHYLKIPSSPKDKPKIENETQILHSLQAMDLKALVVPKPIGNLPMYQNMTMYGGERVEHLTQAHWLALEELHDETFHLRQMAIDPYFISLNEKIKSLPEEHWTKPAQALAVKLKLVAEHMLDKHEIIPFALAHREFTPYNMYVDQEKLHVYNWENAANEPLLFDLFHFVVQSEIFIHKSDYHGVIKKWKEVEQHPFVQRCKRQWGVDLKFHFHLYILSCATNYIDGLNQHKTLSPAMEKFVLVLHRFLDEMTGIYVYNQPLQQVFAKEMFKFLGDQRYALVGQFGQKASKLAQEKELTLCISEKSYVALEFWHRNTPWVEKMYVRWETTSAHWEVYFKDGGFALYHFWFQAMHHEYRVLPMKKALNDVYISLEGIKYLSPAYDLEGQLKKRALENATMGTEILRYYDRLSISFKLLAVQHISNIFSTDFLNFDHLEENFKDFVPIIRQHTQNSWENAWWRRIWRKSIAWSEAWWINTPSLNHVIRLESPTTECQQEVAKKLKEDLEIKFNKKIVLWDAKNDGPWWKKSFLSIQNYFSILQSLVNGYWVIDVSQGNSGPWKSWIGIKPTLSVLVYDSPELAAYKNDSPNLSLKTEDILERHYAESLTSTQTRYLSIRHVRLADTLECIEKEFWAVA